MADAKRTADYGAFEGFYKTIPKEISLEIFRRICFSHFFEYRTQAEDQKKNLAATVYLAAGQESTPAAISTVFPGAHVFGQHRAHALYLSFGGNPRLLVDELLGLKTGSCHGMGGSICVHDPEKHIYAHNGLIAEQVPLVAGAAYAKPDDKFVCVFGDAAVEEDYFFGGLGFAVSQKLPILFVCEDNDLSVLTPTKDRRTWRMEEVVRSMGMPSVDIADDPWLIYYHAKELSKKLPGYMNIRTCRELWHAGSGKDEMEIEWNRWKLNQARMSELGLEKEAKKIEMEEKAKVDQLWDERLQMRSENKQISY
jgi:acetoin:2,6-dichlorophenolindophenol oxidoreductase subunit alpha